MDKLKAIKFFCRVAETRSFVAAAKDLDVVPSVVSKAVVLLEAEVKFRLLNRTTRRVSLTENGAVYYERCKRLVMELEEAEIMTRAGMDRPTGRLVVGVHPAISRVVMARSADFISDFPGIALDTNVTSSVSTMIDDKLDVLIAVGPINSSGLVMQTIGRTKLSAFASPVYLQRFGRPDAPDDLVDHHILISGRRDSPPYTRWTFSRGGRQETIFVTANIICREGVHIQEACLSGAGIARLFDVSVKDHVGNGALRAILPSWSLGDMPIAAVYPSRDSISAKVKAYVRFVRSVLAAGSR